MSASKHHLIHSTSKQQEQIGDFHLTSITPRGSDRTGWHQKHVGAAAFPSRCDLSYCLTPSGCVRSREYWTGMKMYWLLWDDVWTVCLICCLILTCTVIQSPSPPPVNVVTSLCRECEYQRLSFCPFPSPEFRFSFGGFDCHSLSWDCWRIMHTFIFSFSFRGPFFLSQWRRSVNTYYFCSLFMESSEDFWLYETV